MLKLMVFVLDLAGRRDEIALNDITDSFSQIERIMSYLTVFLPTDGEQLDRNDVAAFGANVRAQTALVRTHNMLHVDHWFRVEWSQ